MIKRLVVGVVTSLGAALLVILPADQASASWSLFVYNYHSYEYASTHPAVCGHGLGAYKGFGADDRDLSNNYFQTGCPVSHGGGVVVKNNAGSGVNYNDQRLRVYFNSYDVMGCWCGSTYYTFSADTSANGYGVARDLPEPVKNDNASHHILP